MNGGGIIVTFLLHLYTQDRSKLYGLRETFCHVYPHQHGLFLSSAPDFLEKGGFVPQIFTGVSHENIVSAYFITRLLHVVGYTCLNFELIVSIQFFHFYIPPGSIFIFLQYHHRVGSTYLPPAGSCRSGWLVYMSKKILCTSLAW